jgi:hypothetical protein
MIFFKKRLKPDWTFPNGTNKSGKKVWRLSIGSDVLVAEFRDIDKKTVELAGIDLHSGSALWINDQLPVPSEKEKWWTTLNTIHKDVILLQQYARPDMPTTAKIFVLDLFTGKLLWQNHEVSFMSAVGDTIYCLKKSFPSEKTIGLNFRTGTENEISTPELPGDHYVSPSDLILPDPIENVADDLWEYITRHHHAGLRIPPDVKHAMILKLGQKSVIGFHLPSGKDPKGAALYNAHLIVADSEGRIVFEDVADRNVYVPLADFYFGVGGRLIYVKNSDEIVAIKLE